MTQDTPLQKIKNVLHKFQAYAANVRYGFPANKLKVIAVTGTDGKTTTTSMLYHVFKHAGFKVGYISTIEARIGDTILDTGLHVTTPDPWDVPRYLHMMVDQGIEYVILETTSSGLQQNRVAYITFDAVTITNIKQDHLDYHATWENYAEAKFGVIKQLKPGGLAVLNKDDKKSYTWLKKRLQRYLLETHTTIRVAEYSKDQATAVRESVNGMSFTFAEQSFALPIIGSYNIENALGAIHVAQEYMSLKQIAAALPSFPIPLGRMQIVRKQPFTVIIDFAHTPHAMEMALNAVETIRSNGRLITVFGCAGKRDKSRREMGAISARYADITVLTAEDCRDEKLRDVNNEIFAHAEPLNAELLARFSSHSDYNVLKGMSLKGEINNLIKMHQKPFIAFDEDSVKSREDAILFALSIAEPGDIVFITGKAHEQSLNFAGTEYPWSDHQAVKQALDELQLNSKFPMQRQDND